MPEGIEVYQSYISCFASWGIPAPRVPAHVIPDLVGFSHDLGTRGVDLEPMFAYYPSMMSSPLTSFAGARDPDFFVSGGHGNGSSSMWGFMAKAGGFLCAIQDTVGAAVWDDKDRATDRFGRPFAHYNDLLAQFADRGPRRTDLFVAYSSFRNYAAVLCRDPKWKVSAVDKRSEIGRMTGRGWGVALDLDGESTEDRLQTRLDAEDRLACGHYNEYPELRAAVRFLLTCTAADR